MDPLLPSTTAATLIDGFTDVVTANIAAVLGVLAFTFGVYFVMARLNRAKKNKI